MFKHQWITLLSQKHVTIKHVLSFWPCILLFQTPVYHHSSPDHVFYYFNIFRQQWILPLTSYAHPGVCAVSLGICLTGDSYFCHYCLHHQEEKPETHKGWLHHSIHFKSWHWSQYEHYKPLADTIDLRQCSHNGGIPQLIFTLIQSKQGKMLSVANRENFTPVYHKRIKLACSEMIKSSLLNMFVISRRGMAGLETSHLMSKAYLFGTCMLHRQKRQTE